MLDRYYQRRLQRDLNRWQQDGIVDTQTANRIAQAAAGGQSFSAPFWLALFGMVLLAAAAIAFVAANWAEIPRIGRMGVLILGLLVSYGSAIILNRRGLSGFADLATGLGAALFGAALMLVAQSYHIAGDARDFFFTWAVGAMLAALLGWSRTAMIVSLGIASYWAGLVFSFRNLEIPWAYPAFALPALWLSHRTQFAIGRHLAILGALIWIGTALAMRADAVDWNGWYGVLAISLVFVAIATACAWASQTRHGVFAAEADLTARYATLAAAGGLFLLQFVADTIFRRTMGGVTYEPMFIAVICSAVSIGLLFALQRRGAVPRWSPFALAGVVVALFILGENAPITRRGAESFMFIAALTALTLSISIALILYGQSTMRRHASVAGGLLFAATLLKFYTRTFGSLLDSAGFFLMGGVILIAIALWFVRRQRQQAAPGGAHG